MNETEHQINKIRMSGFSDSFLVLEKGHQRNTAFLLFGLGLSTFPQRVDKSPYPGQHFFQLFLPWMKVEFAVLLDN